MLEHITKVQILSTLNLSDITSTIPTVAMFLTAILHVVAPA
jgi:hypothetical protein